MKLDITKDTGSHTDALSYRLVAVSLNGKQEYRLNIDGFTSKEARAVFLSLITDHVRTQWGITPDGVGYLADPRSIVLHED